MPAHYIGRAYKQSMNHSYSYRAALELGDASYIYIILIMFMRAHSNNIDCTQCMHVQGYMTTTSSSNIILELYLHSYSWNDASYIYIAFTCVLRMH